MALASMSVETGRAAAEKVEIGREAAEKRPGAFRTISEVSDEIAVPQHVLRFWETKFHQIKPVKRGGGRRYYRPEDIDLITGIRRLLHGQGYTIRGAQRVLREGGVRFVQAIGRGEAAAGAPGPQDAEAEAVPAGVLPDAAPEAVRAADLADLGPMEDALRELYACREALAGLRTLTEGVDG